MKILVTGGAGFIGSHLIEKLLEEGHDVVCVDNLTPYYDPELKKARLARFSDRITFYETDITDREALTAIFNDEEIEAVCHLAAQAGVRYSLENPFIYAETNYIGTVNVLELSKQKGIKNVVMASTSSVYGLNEKLPFSEDDRVDHPISIYAASKRACELLAFSYDHLFGLNVTCLRFFTVYGQWGRPDMALFLFTKNILEGKPIEVFGEGNMRRDFTYVSDIVEGFVAALKKPLGFEIINLGAGEPVHLMDFIRMTEKALGKKADIQFKPMQPGDVRETHSDITKAKKLLGYDPKVSIEEGIPAFVEWYRSYFRL